MSRGRPFEPGNKFGRGRPKGSLNKKTQLARKLLDEHSAAILALAINRSREDPQMLRMLASQIISRLRDSRVKLGRLPLDTADDLERASKTLLRRTTSGKLSIREAQEMSSLIEERRRVLETQDLERRLSALEHPDQVDKAA